MARSEAHLAMEDILVELFGSAHAEYQFHPLRKWRFDYAVFFDRWKLACEIDGGAWINGRHNRASGWQKDKEKFNTAEIMDWGHLHFTPREVLNGQAEQTLKAWKKART